MDAIQIIDYEPHYAEDFKKLNLAWIQKYFVVETHDLEQLDHAEDYILQQGGHILFAKSGDTIVGTVALIHVSETEMELAKMAVDEGTQGQGVGKKLCLAAIEKARQLGTKHLFLESNRRLVPALKLYQSVGFQEVTMVETPYARADIRMAMDFE